MKMRNAPNREGQGREEKMQAVSFFAYPTSAVKVLWLSIHRHVIYLIKSEDAEGVEA